MCHTRIQLSITHWAPLGQQHTRQLNRLSDETLRSLICAGTYHSVVKQIYAVIVYTGRLLEGLLLALNDLYNKTSSQSVQNKMLVRSVIQKTDR